jgi:hypothetical protein
MLFRDLFLSFDLFGQNPNLLINHKSQMKTNLGLFVSILAYILFIFILYNELQEVIYKSNPHIITNKFHSDFYNSSITLNEDTFKLILTQEKMELS